MACQLSSGSYLRILNHSSGDLVADRRASYAEALAGEGEYVEAAEVLGQALERAPGWAAGWNNLGRYREEIGDLIGAMAAWRTSAALDGEGRYGAALKLVAYGEASAGGSAAYVETLFDNYAARFETSLVQRLGYGVPGNLARLIAETSPRVGVALDLGCGTGLMGLQLRSVALRLEGVDISEAMLAEARQKAVYDRLVRADLTDHLGTHPGGIDLVTATDVLNYTGALPPILAAVHGRLAPGGCFGFSLETHDGPEALLLRPSLRFVHQPALAITACREAGFEVLAQRPTVIRMDRGTPVDGVLMLARTTA